MVGPPIGLIGTVLRAGSWVVVVVALLSFWAFTLPNLHRGVARPAPPDGDEGHPAAPASAALAGYGRLHSIIVAVLIVCLVGIVAFGSFFIPYAINRFGL